ncbi:MAG: type II toxin-antitoxin system PemK/MazF family toxin [Planctomycetaceae bacterium]
MFGEIQLCRFPLTSGAVGKTRPALVLFDLGLDVLLCRITSVSHSGTLDIKLADWKPTGLLRPSVARLDRLVTAERSILIKRLGQLSTGDAAVIRNAWNQHMKL